MARCVWVTGLFALLFTAAIGERSLLAVGQDASAAQAEQRVPGQGREVRQAVRMLTQEARDVRANGLADDARPDFAQRYDGDLTMETVQQAIIASQHRDPFIDAYIRWQFMSFEPAFPDLDDRTFLRMLDELPALLENPRGKAQFMDLIARAETLNELSSSDFEQLQQLDDEQRNQMHRAELLNRPAMELREWIKSGVADSLMRTIQALLEECAATIEAAWPPRAVKSALTRAFTAAADELSVREKNLLAEQARGLVGRERRFVNRITYFADRSINVSYSRPRVSQRDYDRWMQRLAGEE